MKKLLLTVFATANLGLLSAQQIIYQNEWNAAATPNDTTFKIVQEADGDLYKVVSYHYKSGKKNYEGVFADKFMHKMAKGVFKYYDEQGNLQSERTIGDFQVPVNTVYYYPNGKVKGLVEYEDGKLVKSEAYDIDGTPKKVKVVEQEAIFPNGNEGWKKFLIENMNGAAPVEAGMPAGMYVTYVLFSIDTTGKAHLKSTYSEGKECKACEKEAGRMIKTSPRWTPAIHFDEPKIAYRRQPVTFVVHEEKKRRRD